ncbi:unnamed protein product [Allacma fusca]|uniref:ORC1/DEAH AAA+ ATPase domain-containing protein n=1 Tax=Allacma fusca TaxID=39272 RepID=A0A8J2KKV2_9HEXA|nr:unnamed protein product [Allacma fusca]
MSYNLKERFMDPSNVTSITTGVAGSITAERVQVNVHTHETIQPGKVPPESIEFNTQDHIPSFTGRKTILAELHDVIEQNKTTGQLTVLSQTSVITGMGGVGKTETVRKYLNEYKAEYTHTLWINAETYSEAKSCFYRLAALISISPTDFEGNPKQDKFVVEEIYDFICRKPALIIFDNAQSLDKLNEDGTIRPFLPGTIKTGWTNPAIIVTSRNRDWGHIQPIELPGLTDTECFELLRSQLEFEDSPENRGLAKEISDLCEGLPLMVQQVIAVIKEETEVRDAMDEQPYTMADFLSDIREGRQDYLEKRPADPCVGDSASQIFRITFNKLVGREHGLLAMRLLGIMALLNPDNIPTTLLRFLLKTDKPRDVPQALILLNKYNLVTKCQNFYKIHRVLQLVIVSANDDINHSNSGSENESAAKRLKTSNDGSSTDQILAEIIPQMHQFLSQMEPTESNAYTILQNGVRLAKHIYNRQNGSSKTSEYLEFLELLSQKLAFHRKDSDAEGVYREILRTPGFSDRQNNESKNIQMNLALALTNQGKHSDAAEIYTKLLNHWEQILGQHHPTAMTIKHNLADVLRNQGKYNEAVVLYEGVLKNRGNVLGERHVDTVSTKNSLANVLRDQGKYPEAAQLFEEVLQYRENVLGSSHFATISTKNSLATVLDFQGKYEPAVVLYNDVIENRRNTLGRTHPETMNAISNLAIVFCRHHNLDKGAELFSEVIENKIAILGRTHPDTNKTRNNLASVYRNQSKYDEAVQIYNEIIENSTNVLGPKHPETLLYRFNLAKTFNNQGRYDEAITIFTEILETREAVLGPDHPSTMDTKHCLADGYHNKKEYKRAIELYKEVLKFRDKILGPDHLDTIDTKNNLATVLRDEEHFDDAVRLHEEVVKASENKLGPTHAKVLGYKNSLVEALIHQGSFSEAVTLCRQTLQSVEKVFEPTQSDVLKITNNLNRVLRLTGE